MQKGQTTLTVLLSQPVPPQPVVVYNSHELLKMRNAAFETLLLALRSFDHAHHRQFVIRVLTTVVDLPNLDNLSIVSLVNVLFDVIDACSEIKQIVNVQNALIDAAWVSARYTCNPRP